MPAEARIKSCGLCLAATTMIRGWWPVLPTSKDSLNSWLPIAVNDLIHIQNICDLIKFDSHIEGDPCAGQIVLTDPKVKVSNQVYRLTFI